MAKAKVVLATPKGICLYPSLATPDMREAETIGKDQYKCTILIDKAVWAKEGAAIEAAVLEVAKETYNNPKLTLEDLEGTSNPIKCGDAKFKKLRVEGKEEGREYYQGKVILSAITAAKSVTLAKGYKDPQPQVVDGLKRGIDPALVEGGDIVRLSISPFGYAKQGNKGVSFSLRAVQLIEKGTPIGGVSAISVFGEELSSDIVSIDDDEFSFNVEEKPAPAPVAKSAVSKIKL